MGSKTYRIKEPHTTETLNFGSTVLVQNHANRYLYISVNNSNPREEGLVLTAGLMLDINIKAGDKVFIDGDNVDATVVVIASAN